MKRVTIIGAGLTGLTLAFLLKKAGFKVFLLEKTDKLGGTMQTHEQEGFTFEEGPNTGVVSNSEVVELFNMLDCKIQIADTNAEKRLILKNNVWYPLPSNAISFMKTPLFSLKDKFAICFEPLKSKGSDSEESVASLAKRRIGASFVDYAVDPFVSGIYAGDPDKLITKYALPKLYNLEQKYGSFIGGGLRKKLEKKTEKEKKITKKVFSVEGGFRQLISSLKEKVDDDNIIYNVSNVIIDKFNDIYNVEYCIDDKSFALESNYVITTVGGYALSNMLPFANNIEAITNLNYAKVIQVAVALKKDSLASKYTSFGGLIPQKENKKLLGILFPSCCFTGRAPSGCDLLAVYLGGTKHPEFYSLSDQEINDLVCDELTSLFDIDKESICFTRVFRHYYAIAQYEKSSKKRLDAIQKIEGDNPGLILAGNIRDGIGIADRIRQAFEVSKRLSAD